MAQIVGGWARTRAASGSRTGASIHGQVHIFQLFTSTAQTRGDVGKALAFGGGQENDMRTNANLEPSLDILIDELLNDDELRLSFMSNPYAMLETAGDWGIPLTDTELRALRANAPMIWERVADELSRSFGRAA